MDDTIKNEKQIKTDEPVQLKSSGGSPRLVFSSKEQIENTMENLISGKKLKDIIPGIKIKEIKHSNELVLQNAAANSNTDNEDAFLAYSEYIKSEFLANLNPAIRDLLESDPDFDGFRLLDDVDIEPEVDTSTLHLGIMPALDFDFASILNEKREVQLGTKIYKYTKKGIVVVDEEYAAELDSIDIDKYLETITLEANRTDEPQTINILQHMALVILPIMDGDGG
jgi:hypothetical protein